MIEDNNIIKANDYGIPIIRSESHILLEKFVKAQNPVNILEIGTAIGYSGKTILNSCNGNLVTIEHDLKLAKIAKQTFKDNGLDKRANVIVGDCMVEVAKMVASKKFDNYFDFVFLDGPKAQYDLLLDSLILLLKPSGTFVADNVLFRGYVESNTAPTKRYKTIIKRLDNFIKNCKNHPKLANFKLYNIEDGVIFANKVQ